MRKILSSFCWIVWGAYFLIWPLDTLISNFEPSYSNPQEGFVQKALFDYITAYNYLFLAAIVLSAVYLLQRCISRRVARPAQTGIGLQSFEPTSDAGGANRDNKTDFDSTSLMSDRKWRLAAIVILVTLYAVSLWFRPFLNAPTVLAAFWIGVLLVTFVRRRAEGVRP
jgi:xanthine/uracil permease